MCFFSLITSINSITVNLFADARGTITKHVIVFVGNLIFDVLRIDSDPAPDSVAAVASLPLPYPSFTRQLAVA